MRKFKRAGIENPFYCPEIENLLSVQETAAENSVLHGESGVCAVGKGE